MRPLSIGQVARTANVSVDTIRFYERRGVLPPAPRQASGYRTFTEAAVERIRFARRLQRLGFSLDEVVGLLGSVDSATADCRRSKRHFEQVLERVDAQLVALRAVRRELVNTLARCEAGSCTLLDPVSRSR